MSGQSVAANPTFSTATQRLEERPPSFAWKSLRQEFTTSPTRVRSAARLALAYVAFQGAISFVVTFAPSNRQTVSLERFVALAGACPQNRGPPRLAGPAHQAAGFGLNAA